MHPGNRSELANSEIQAHLSDNRHLSTKRRKEGLLGRISFALLSYASIDHCEEKTLSKTKNCQVCGSDFECKGLLGCWCRSMDISREQLGELSKRTSGCICPNCLAGYKDRELYS